MPNYLICNCNYTLHLIIPFNALFPLPNSFLGFVQEHHDKCRTGCFFPSVLYFQVLSRVQETMNEAHDWHGERLYFILFFQVCHGHHHVKPKQSHKYCTQR